MPEDTRSTQRSVNADAADEADTLPQQAVAQLRVALMGRAGAGKTALARALFGAQRTHTSSAFGDFARYEDEATEVIVDDLPGWASGSEESLSALFSFLEDERSAGQPFVMVWYALDAASARVTDYELQLVRRFAQLYPVVLVLTRTDLITEEALAAMRSTIDTATIPNCLGIVPVAADPLPALGISPSGIDEVMSLTTRYAETLRKNLPDHQDAASARIAQLGSQQGMESVTDQARHSQPPTDVKRVNSRNELTDEEAREGTANGAAAIDANAPWALIALLTVILLALALLLGRRRRNAMRSFK
jgi:GTP-binding protein EngB required for normal cell division